MKTLKQIAATFNMFTAQDVPAKYLEPGNQLPTWLPWFTPPSIPEFLLNHPNIEVDYFYQGRTTRNAGTNEENHSIESGSLILLKHKDSSVIMVLFNERGKQHLSFSYKVTDKYQNAISHHLQTEATKHLKKPNLVGVWNDKKLADWVTHCQEYYNCLEEKYQEVTGANQKHEEEIKRVINALQPCRVIERHDGSTDYTYIETKYFEVTATHIRGSKHLSFTSKFKGDVNDVIALTEHSKNM